MDQLTFIAKVIEALAWPVAAIVLVVLLRGELSRLLPLVKRLKAGPLEAEFEREVRELRSGVKESLTGAELAPSSWQQTAERLAEVSPRSAILEAWREVETNGRKTLLNRDPQLTESHLRSTREVLRLLGEKGILSIEEVGMLNQMRYLRNQAVHVESFDPTLEAAINFIHLASYLLARMEVAP